MTHWPARIGVAFVAGGSIAALLAELYDVASMAAVLWAISLPSILALVLFASHPRFIAVRALIRVGAIGGLLGTLAYDLFRVPFMLAGMRVFAPISSYGLMGAAADQSSGWTTSLGWAYHLSNGVTFGIVFALLASRRSRWWAVGWGLMLEAVAFLGPFTSIYGLTGKTGPIVVAFAAHVAYGYPLGVVVERFDEVAGWLEARRFAVTSSIGAAVVAILLMFSPWSSSPAEQEARRLAAEISEPVAVVEGVTFVPEWLRVAPGGCITVVNPQDVAVVTDLGEISAGGERRWCFADEGVTRVRVDGQPWSGGFVMVDG